MRYGIIGLLSGLMMVAIVNVLPGRCGDMEDVKAVLEGQTSAFAAADIGTWSKYWVQDAGFTMINRRTVFASFSELKEAVLEFHKNITVADPKISDVEIHVSGDVAWAVFTNHWIAKYKDGRPDATNLGTVTVGLIKQDGQWKILRFHETEK